MLNDCRELKKNGRLQKNTVVLCTRTTVQRAKKAVFEEIRSSTGEKKWSMSSYTAFLTKNGGRSTSP